MAATPPNPARIVADLGKRAIRRFPGKLPAYRWRLAVLRAPRLPGLVRFEASEAARALESWGRRPVASVAAIIPTYRRPEELLNAVESVLGQTWRDLVVVVIDDGGGLPPLPEDERLFAYTMTRNCGVAGVVRNVGIRASASRYLAFLDDDNVWLPEHLEVAMARHATGAQLTYSGLERVLPDGTRKDVLSLPFDRMALREDGFCDTNTLVVQRGRSVRFSRVPIRHGEFPLEDWEMVYRLSRRVRTEHIPQVTVRYLVHDRSFFTDWEAAAREDAKRARGGAEGHRLS